MPGLFSLKEGSFYYSLHFQDLGWMAADLVQYLGDILEASGTRRQAALLKLLGMTLRITHEEPERQGQHWVVVDLEARQLDTNSEMLRLAVAREDPPPDSPYNAPAMRRIYEVLDRHDFTVNLYR